MLTDHQYYEELSALVVSAQASAAQIEEYNEHAERCAECREDSGELAVIAQLLTLHESAKAIAENPPVGMTERFVARARGEGIPLSPQCQVAKPVPKFSPPWVLPLAAMLIVGFGIWLLFSFRAGIYEAVRNKSNLPPNPSAVSVSPLAQDSALAQEQASLSKQLRDAQGEAAQFRAALDSQRKGREAVEAKVEELTQQIDTLQHQLVDARRTESEHSEEIARLEGQLKTVSSERDNYRVDALSQKADLLDSHNKLESANQELQEAQHLSAAANEANDLIVARNLHIVDVHDNENGNKPRPFGRIFYAEGKKLVFYAYDLGDPQKLSAKVSFYVWGEKAGAKEVKNLGIFRADDRQDGRWVLTFDDPRVLARINTIFVTSESNSRRITKPNGNRILTAFLDDAPNHP